MKISKMFLLVAVVLAIGILLFVVDDGIKIPFISDNDINTFGDFGDNWGERTLNVNFDVPPTLSQDVCVKFDAEITDLSDLGIDEFGVYVLVNGIGGYSWYWTPVVVEGELNSYTLILPSDINNDGIVDWKVGINTLLIRTASYTEQEVSLTGVRKLEVAIC